MRKLPLRTAEKIRSSLSFDRAWDATDIRQEFERIKNQMQEYPEFRELLKDTETSIQFVEELSQSSETEAVATIAGLMAGLRFMALSTFADWPKNGGRKKDSRAWRMVRFVYNLNPKRTAEETLDVAKKLYPKVHIRQKFPLHDNTVIAHFKKNVRAHAKPISE